MARFVVMQKGTDVSGAVFVRDSFSVPALIVPWLWLAFHRQWLAAVAVVSVHVLAAIGSWRFEAPLLMLGADLLTALYVALEGATLRIATLERAGFSEVAVVEANDGQEAEIRYFGTLPQQDSGAQTTEPATPSLRPASADRAAFSNAFAFPARG
jgi:hypothetical protein